MLVCLARPLHAASSLGLGAWLFVGATRYNQHVMRDTSEAALDRYYELLRARSPLSRITATAALTSAVRRLAESAVRTADPDASDTVVRARVTMRLYGREVASRLFPDVVLDVR